MQFCPQCNNLLRATQKGNKRYLACGCGYEDFLEELPEPSSLQSTSNIYVYGHGKGWGEFSTEDEIIKFLSDTLYSSQNGRYRHSNMAFADIIVFSWNGSAYGHLVIEEVVDPSEEDKKEFSKARKVYLVSSSAVYEDPVNLNSLGIRDYQFGKQISEEDFELIKENVGKISHFP